MNPQDTLLWIAIAFTVALVIQVVLLTMMTVASLRTRRQVQIVVAKIEPVIEKMGPIAETSQAILNDVRKYAGEISGKTNELLDLSRKQLGRVDEVMAEATARTRTQMDRIEMVMDDTVNRFQETTSLLQTGIVKPLRQINALTAGIRTAFSVLAGARRTTVEQATHDEEMFI
jgi:hypothetical protein